MWVYCSCVSSAEDRHSARSLPEHTCIQTEHSVGESERILYRCSYLTCPSPYEHLLNFHVVKRVSQCHANQLVPGAIGLFRQFIIFFLQGPIDANCHSDGLIVLWCDDKFIVHTASKYPLVF